MLIRNYRNSDKERIMELFNLSTPEFFSPNEKSDLEYYLSDHSENYFVVLIQNKLVAAGGINTTDTPNKMRISWDLVHPDYRGKGLGSDLTYYRIEVINSSEEKKLIEVRTSQKVYRFYEKQGFVLKETVKDFWAKGFDLYRMEYQPKSVKK